MSKEKKSIVLINEATGERKELGSINAAARFLGTTFFAVQRAAMYNGTWDGWRVYDNPDTIRMRIAALEEQLKVVEGK